MLEMSENKVLWGNLLRGQKFYVLHHYNGRAKSVLFARAPHVIQESYTEGAIPEDLVSVFASQAAVALYIDVLKNVFNEHFIEDIRIVAMSSEELLTMVAELDKQYTVRQDVALRVDVCEAFGGELRREILFSRQVPKH